MAISTKSATSAHSTAVPTIHIRDIPTKLAICEPNLRGACPAGCDYHHWRLPYLWQINVQELGGWQSLLEESERVEAEYCKIEDRVVFEVPFTSPSGTSVIIRVEINFSAMKAQLRPPDGSSVVVDVRRLTTQSYAADTVPAEASVGRYYTQWRWYLHSTTWNSFTGERRTPMQRVLETKFLSSQEVFRFVEEISGQQQSKLVFLIRFKQMEMQCLTKHTTWKIRRRPMFVVQEHVKKGKTIQSPPTPPNPLLATLPQTWYPVDPQQQSELVPLNPESLAFHLVASEFYSSVDKSSRRIMDVYLVQNPFLWNQFSLKKTLMQTKRPAANLERQLFHGTSDDLVVEAICRENFDWRVSGKNNIVFGRGSYFAKDASYSDKYTGSKPGHKWMFLARVLVGKYTKGNSSLVRPTPLDAAFPHGDCHDSCVDDPANPRIFVIFEKDQCYPEYLISYSTT